ncbi:MAG: hypothetical protein V3T17_09875 [Pseudomonadales bacterium]
MERDWLDPTRDNCRNLHPMSHSTPISQVDLTTGGARNIEIKSREMFSLGREGHDEETLNAMKEDSPYSHYNLIGKHESEKNRLVLMTGIFGFALLAIIIMLAWGYKGLLDTVEFTTKHQNVTLYPEANGVYVHKSKPPVSHLQSFIYQFIQNRLNYNPDAIVINFDAAKRMMSQSYRLSTEDNWGKITSRTAQLGIMQTYNVINETLLIEEKKDHYFVTITGKLIRSVSNVPYLNEERQYWFKVNRVKPSAYYEWAVVIDEMGYTKP